MNNNKKYELLLEICEFYGYDVSEENEKIICHYNKEYHFEYSNIDEALCDWYDTLIETNHNHECYSDTNQYTTWNKEDIDFIRDILKDREINTVASYSENEEKIMEKCNHCKKEVFLEDKYDLQECPNCGEYILPYDSKEKIVVGEIHDVDNVNEFDDKYDFQMYFDFENSDIINNYLMDRVEGLHFIGCMVNIEDGVFDMDNCKIDMVWHGNDSNKHFYFTDEQIRTIKDKVIKEIKDNNMGEVKDREDKNKIKKGEVNNMSALQIKYDLDLKYKGTDFVGVLECHKIECKGIPCVKDDRLELVNVLYLQKGEENYIVKFIEINNVIYSISDMKYWYGISSEELFEQIDCLINKQEIPNSYIKVSDKFYKVERLEDILRIEAEGEITECFIENDSLLFDVVCGYIGKNITSLVGDLDTLMSYVNLDEDALLALLKENPNIIYWLNYVDVYCYDTTDKEEAYRIHLEEEEEIPYRALDYMDVLSYVEEELDLKTIITSNSTVLYC